MDYVNFRGTKLSKLSLGTVQFGLDYGIANHNGKVQKEEVFKILNSSLKSGINIFDTAQGYGNSEEVIGECFTELEYDKHVITKTKSALFKERPVNLSNYVKESLSKLHINTLFGLLLHDCDLLPVWSKDFEEKVQFLKELKLIKYFGASIYTENDFELSLNNPSIDIIQIPFNLFDQRAITNNWFDRAEKAGKLLVIRSVFLQGLLLLESQSLPKSLEKASIYIDKIDRLCGDYNIERSLFILSFTIESAKNSILLFGCDSCEQLENNIDSYNSRIKFSNSDYESVCKEFRDVEENIYNPIRW